MSQKHTPGPWEMVAPAGGLWPPRIFAGSKFIAMVNNSDDTQDQRIIDARLIASAPDLLSIVERFVALGAKQRRGARHTAEKASLMEQALAAIAKATKGDT